MNDGGNANDNLTVLDWFAGQALTGILGSRHGFLIDCGTSNAPQWAYDIAERMLAERVRRPLPEAPENPEDIT